MADDAIQRGIQLCQQALQGGALMQTEALRELSNLLQSMATTPTVTAGTALPLSAQQIFEQLQEPFISMDLNGYVTGWNPGAQSLFGYEAQESIGQHLLFLYADESSVDSIDLPGLFLEQGNAYIEVHRRKKSGESFRAGLSLSVLYGSDHEAVGLVAYVTEIPPLQASNEAQRLHASIVEDSDQGILVTDMEQRIVSVNAAFSRITGYSQQEALGQSIDLLRSGMHSADIRTQVLAAMQGAGPWHGEIIGKRKNGEIFPQSVSISVVRNDTGDVTHAFSIFSDISVLRASEERLQHLVNYDSLTGLPNRTLFNQILGPTLTAASRTSACAAFLAIDLNRFTVINDTLGHDVGDEVLRQVGQRLRQALRDEDVLSRIGGGEFVVALLSIHKREHSGYVAQKLLAALATPFVVDSNIVHINASMGIAVFPDDGSDAESLLRFSNVALKRLRADNDSGYLFYSPEMNQRAKEEWQLEGELRQALDARELRLHYQPKVSLRSGRIVGAEALIRWQHPVRGLIPPGAFIPVAEETGLILDIGNWVLEEACRQIRQWMDGDVAMPPIAVNLSARQFDRMLPSRIQAVLDHHGVPPAKLKLEITESLLVRGTDSVIPIMNELVAMGLELAMDDFGTGYSSLAHLKKFPITTLKIDRSFVIGIPQDDNDRAIALAIITLGKQLRMEIVAEGVETIEQMAFLRELECDQLQGFLFSPALTEIAFEDLVRQDMRLTLG